MAKVSKQFWGAKFWLIGKTFWDKYYYDINFICIILIFFNKRQNSTSQGSESSRLFLDIKFVNLSQE